MLEVKGHICRVRPLNIITWLQILFLGFGAFVSGKNFFNLFYLDGLRITCKFLLDQKGNKRSHSQCLVDEFPNISYACSLTQQFTWRVMARQDTVFIDAGNSYSLVTEHAIVPCNSRMNNHKKQKITWKMYLFSTIHFSRPWSEVEFVIVSLLRDCHLGSFVLVSY